MGSGLQKILKMYGRITVKNEHGRKVVHVWDYAQDRPRIESEMTKEEKELSDKAKWEMVKVSMEKKDKENNGNTEQENKDSLF